MSSVLTLARTGLFFLCMAGWWLWLHRRWELPLALAPAVSFCSIGCVLYLAALLNVLWPVQVLLAGGLALLARELFRGRLTALRPLACPAVAVYAAGCGWTVLLLRGALVQGHDNFAHWAIMAKSLITNGQLPNVANTAVEYVDYPPAAALWIKFVCNAVGFSDGTMLMAQGFLALACALALGLIGYILWRGMPGLSWEFLTTQESIMKGTDGILPAIQNTLYVILVTLVIVLPLGVGAAVYLTEYATNRRLTGAIEFATETLAGIPSILYALVGMLVFCQFCDLGTTLLAGSLTLVIMTLPTIIRTTQESLKTVPQSYREGSLGLGSGKWHMIRTVVLPSSVDGIVTGCILAVGRIVGESAILMYTVSVSTMMQDFSTIENFLKSSGATLTVALYVYAKERADFAVAFSIATILLILTVVINLAASLAGKKLKR